MDKLGEVMRGLECIRDWAQFTVNHGWIVGGASEKMVKYAEDALALLKALEPVKPILARGWYWCGGVRCRYSPTSALDDDSPARKPNYCEKCGRAVKWE